MAIAYRVFEFNDVDRIAKVRELVIPPYVMEAGEQIGVVRPREEWGTDRIGAVVAIEAHVVVGFAVARTTAFQQPRIICQVKKGHRRKGIGRTCVSKLFNEVLPHCSGANTPITTASERRFVEHIKHLGFPLEGYTP